MTTYEITTFEFPDNDHSGFAQAASRAVPGSSILQQLPLGMLLVQPCAEGVRIHLHFLDIYTVCMPAWSVETKELNPERGARAKEG